MRKRENKRGRHHTTPKPQVGRLPLEVTRTRNKGTGEKMTNEKYTKGAERDGGEEENNNNMYVYKKKKRRRKKDRMTYPLQSTAPAPGNNDRMAI